MGDTPDLGSGAARRGGSSPLPGNTKQSLLMRYIFFALFVLINKIHATGPDMLNLLPPTDPLLSATSKEVPLSDIPSNKIQTIIDEMYEIASGKRLDSQKSVLVGLAAPQLGVMKRIILVDVGFSSEKRAFGQLKAFINPKILFKSREYNENYEGCYSADNHLIGVVPRSTSIKISAYDRDGHFFEEEFEGLTARIFQHECDHLVGIRFPDRVGKDGTLHWVEKDQIADYRKNWKSWPTKCPWDKWLTMCGKN